MLVVTSSPIYVNGKREEDAFSSLDGNSKSDEILLFQKWVNAQSWSKTKPYYPLKEDGKWGAKSASAYKELGKRYEMYLEDLMFDKVDTKNRTTTSNTDNPILIKNPFRTKTGLVTFQKWVLTKDPTILKNFGADGIWGRTSSDAWRKYGVEYLQLFSPEGTPIDIDLANTSTPTSEEVKIQMDKLKFPFSYSLSSVGFALGIAYAVNNKTGFWKGLGYSLIFSIAGASLGAGIDYLRKPKKDEKAK